MVAVNIKAFRGQIPRVSNRLLQPNQATRALNCKLTSGRLDPLFGLGLALTSPRPLIKTMFRYRHIFKSVVTDNWLVFGEDVNVVQSPLSNDAQGKFYFASSSFEPRMSTYEDAISGTAFPNAWFALGVIAPTAAPSVAVAGGTTPVESRAYAYTFVTRLGEESGPSPASTLVSGNANGTWTVSGMQTAPANSGAITAAVANTPSTGLVRVTLNTTFGLSQFDTLTFDGVVGMTSLNGTFRIQAINGNQVDIVLSTAQTYTSGGTWTRPAPHNTLNMKKRIYRSAGLDGNFLFVAEVDASTTSYADTLAATALGEVIPTLNTLPPPKNLVSLATLPNGCLVGLSENELCFSDPYMPYSWPTSNRYSFSGRGVALVPAGNSVIVLTETYPIIFVGSDPEAMTPSTMETFAPCVSKRGVVNVGGGCLYPSYDGLWLAAPGRVENLTKRLYREDEWKLLNPKSFDAAFQDGQYYGYYQTEDGLTKRIWVMDINEPDSVSEVEQTADALYRNDYDGVLYLSKGNQIFAWDSNPGQAYSADWISAVMQLAKPTNFAVAQVHADFQATIPPNTTQITANQALITQGADAVAGWLNGQELLAVEINGSFIVPAVADLQKKVQFTLYRDDVPVYSRTVTSSNPFRLPAGYKSELFRVGINSSVPTYSVTVAESVAELSQVSS